MTLMRSFLPPMTGSMLPPATPEALDDNERAWVQFLDQRLTYQSISMKLSDAYYEGVQRIPDLGISVPPNLAHIRTVVDWARVCVDPIVARQVVQGFRLPGATEVDDDLWDIWQANNMDAESPLTYLDKLVYGRGYMIAGTGDDGDALITTESPLNVAMEHDPKTRKGIAAYQSFEESGEYRAALYLPNVNIYMSRQPDGRWEVTDRDQHGLGELAVVRFANRARTKSRDGRSEITPAIMSTIDSTCRTLLGMEIAREFYSVPHKWAVGVSQSDFVDKDGNPIPAWQATMSKFLALENDETGATPKVGQFTAYDPSTYTRIVDQYAQLMASFTSFPPAYFGNASSANPASADAIRVGEAGINRRADQANVECDDPQETVMRLAWRIRNGGKPAPKQMMRLETDWADTATATPAATTDAMTKQIQVGAVPATSDVVLKRLGYSAVERSRLEQDRKAAEGDALLARIAGQASQAPAAPGQPQQAALPAGGSQAGR